MTAWTFDEQLRSRLEANLAELPREACDDDALRRAAVAVALLAGEDGAASFVLTRRAARMRAHGGQWALPGGGLDQGESAVDAARRELAEEVGVRVDGADVLGVLDDYPTRSGYAITPVVVWCGGTVELVPDPREVMSAHRIPLTELTRPDSPRFTAIPESDRPLIQLPILDHVISAPTAAVLHQFAEVGLHGRHTRVSHYEQPLFAWK